MTKTNSPEQNMLAHNAQKLQRFYGDGAEIRRSGTTVMTLVVNDVGHSYPNYQDHLVVNFITGELIIQLPTDLSKSDADYLEEALQFMSTAQDSNLVDGVIGINFQQGNFDIVFNHIGGKRSRRKSAKDANAFVALVTIEVNGELKLSASANGVHRTTAEPKTDGNVVPFRKSGYKKPVLRNPQMRRAVAR